jgi:hypothetical protein
MQTKEIIELMKGQCSYNEQTLNNLSNILEEYPYFQTARLLYAMNLLHLKDTRFPPELRKTAMYLSDRKKMFYLVENDFFTPDVISALQMETGKKEENASFDLIDAFLSENKDEITERNDISTDYISYFLSDETTEEEKKIAPQMPHQDMIDKFLEKNEKSPVKIELKNEKEYPDNPVPDFETVDEDSFFSETLAKIYIKQKKFSKALEIIRKLNLIYPEKSRYFADQIRFLEKLIINTK